MYCPSGPFGVLALRCIPRLTFRKMILEAFSAARTVVGSFDSDTPSKNRWGTMTRHGSRQTGGHMTNNIMSRTIQAAFTDYNRVDLYRDPGLDDAAH